MTKPIANRLRRFLAVERKAHPHRNTRALYRRPVRMTSPVRAYLRIDRGIEA